MKLWVKSIPAAVLAVAASLSTCLADEAPATFPRDKVTAIIDGVRKITTAEGIEELKAIPIGGLQQWISVRGRSRNNPILLFIHGGPASTEIPAQVVRVFWRADTRPERV
jgi:proline iminopeptidase